MDKLKELYEVKEQINKLNKKRIEIEESIRNDFSEGTETIEDNDFQLKITGKLNVSIDKEKLIEIATKNNLLDKLEYYFRWKPEIEMKNWKNGGEKELLLLSGAITKKPAKLSFVITKKEESKK